MSFMLTDLMPKLKSRDVSPGSPLAQAYNESLKLFWGREFDKSLDKLSSALIAEADVESSQETFACYRLWLEILAEQKDEGSLTALAEHLLARSKTEPKHYNTYAAIRGLIYLELDMYHAAKTYSNAVTDQVDDPYCLELVQKVEARTESKSEAALVRHQRPFFDYFHWRSLVFHLIASRELENAQVVIDYMQKLFRAAPLAAEFEYHRCMESALYAAAAIVAGRLNEMYPQHPDYGFYEAYAFYEDGNYPKAKEKLNDLVQKLGENDPELVGLYGHTLAKMGEAERARYYLSKSINLWKSEGLPYSHVQQELNNVDEELRGNDLDPMVELPRQTKLWLIELSPRRYHELRTASENHIEKLLRPMGNVAMPGDFVLFAGLQKKNNKVNEWQIAAIYTVDSEPIWHPTHRYHNVLQLVSRPAHSIPVDVEHVDGHSQDNSFGVLELEMSALDIITEAVRQKNDDLLGSTERRQVTRIGKSNVS